LSCGSVIVSSDDAAFEGECERRAGRGTGRTERAAGRILAHLHLDLPNVVESKVRAVAFHLRGLDWFTRYETHSHRLRRLARLGLVEEVRGAGGLGALGRRHPLYHGHRLGTQPVLLDDRAAAIRLDRDDGGGTQASGRRQGQHEQSTQAVHWFLQS
jgi:hypothetical protein